ncbi:MAG: FAD:protein FMN transferase [Acidobacteria bacterium]|nr:MAG: FAD:protein FMN transferase [Acidobacteriota bacterium]
MYFLWANIPASLSQELLLTRFEFTQPHMGTLFRIVCYARDTTTAERASNAAFDRIAGLDHIMSDYSPTSELTLLCQQAGGPPTKVSEDLFCVLSGSQETARLSEGAFDVTVGPLVRLWRRARRTRELPDPARLAQALELVGVDKLRLDEKSRTVQLLRKGMALDLGGIAKGYAADEALKLLDQHGIDKALVAAGGDIAVSGSPPGSDGWNIGIAPLESPETPPTRYLRLCHAAVSTSGDAEQFVEIGGKRYSHIVDPRTGIGLIGHSSVTVVAPKGIASDSLATAVSVLGPKRGLELVDSMEGTAALILQATADGVGAYCSKRWKD